MEVINEQEQKNKSTSFTWAGALVVAGFLGMGAYEAISYESPVNERTQEASGSRVTSAITVALSGGTIGLITGLTLDALRDSSSNKQS